MLKPAIVIPLILLCSAQVWAAPTDEFQRTQRELKELRQRIDSTTQRLRQIATRVDGLHQELGKLERRLAELHGEIKQSQREIAELQGQLKQLDLERRKQQRGLRKQQGLLNKQLKVSLILGQQSTLKFLLNQEDPNSLGRNLYLFKRLNNQRAAKVQSLRRQLLELDRIEVEMDKKTQRLKHSQRLNQRAKGQLQVTLNSRRQLLANLHREQAGEKDRLTQLKADERRLGQLLERIKPLIPHLSLQGRPFAQLKGRLLWPIKQSRHHALEKLQGIMIPAAPGSPVRAVAPGQVIFAEWLRAYGLLLIINHGDGYLSLYGFNQQLHKKLGDSVAAGEVIAATGDTGGQSESGLYFELRKETRVLDVRPWMAKKFSMINK